MARWGSSANLFVPPQQHLQDARVGGGRMRGADSDVEDEGDGVADPLYLPFAERDRSFPLPQLQSDLGQRLLGVGRGPGNQRDGLQQREASRQRLQNFNRSASYQIAPAAVAQERKGFVAYLKEEKESFLFCNTLYRRLRSGYRLLHFDDELDQVLETYGTAGFCQLKLKQLKHEMVQLFGKFVGGAALWQTVSLWMQLNNTIKTAVTTDLDEMSLDQAGIYAGYCVATGFAATLGCIALMWGTQTVLEGCFQGEKASDLKTCSKQMLWSMPLAEGLWAPAAWLRKLNPWGGLAYFAEATIFNLIQNWRHRVTLRENNDERPEGRTKIRTSFHATGSYTLSLGLGYLGFDILTNWINQAIDIDNDSFWTVGTAVAGAVVFPLAHYLIDLIALIGLIRILQGCQQDFDRLPKPQQQPLVVAEPDLADQQRDGLASREGSDQKLNGQGSRDSQRNLRDSRGGSTGSLPSDGQLTAQDMADLRDIDINEPSQAQLQAAAEAERRERERIAGLGRGPGGGYGAMGRMR